MALQNLVPPTPSVPTGKRSNTRKRPRNFEEEEYLAMCLVKLARGTNEVLKPPPSLLKYSKFFDREKVVSTKTTEEKSVLIVKKDQEPNVVQEEKVVLPTMDVKKDQEPKAHVCNVCNKSFSCHQALGGHMASHRNSKPRTVVSGVKKNVKSSAGGKDHRCGECHQTFTSGQALGGHMRKHFEGVLGSGFVGVSAKKRSSDGRAKSPNNGARVSTGRVLDIDLNVALPVDDDDDDLYCHEPASSAF